MAQPQTELKAALVAVSEQLQSCIDLLESDEVTQDAANTVKASMIAAQSMLSESFIQMRSLRREVFALQSGQTQHGDAARSA